jgi:hypothetical protein
LIGSSSKYVGVAISYQFTVQGPMALIAAGSGVAAYLNTVDVNKNVLLGAALLTFSVWPYTLLAVMPTNEQLLDGDGMFFTISFN